MKSLRRVLLIVIAVAVVAGAVFLVTWDIPPPTASIERDLPDERFPR